MRKDGNKWFTQWTRSMLRKANDPLSHSWSKIGRSSGSKSFQWLSLFLSFLLHRIALSNEAWGSLHSILLSSWLESLHRPSHSFILVPILTHLPLRSNQEHKQGGNQRKRYYRSLSSASNISCRFEGTHSHLLYVFTEKRKQRDSVIDQEDR